MWIAIGIVVVILGLAGALWYSGKSQGATSITAKQAKQNLEELRKDAKVKAKPRKRGSSLIESMRKRMRKNNS